MIRLGLAFLLCVSFTNVARAHEGHDHGAEAPRVAVDRPRLEAAGSELELVAVAQGHRLILYLDRLATNEPVDGAEIEVAGEGITPLAARRTGEGTYEIEANWVDEPGTKALIFTVTVGGVADLLAGTLDVHAAQEAYAAAPAPWTDVLASPWLWAIAALAAGFGFFLAFAFRPLRLPSGDREGSTVTLPSITVARSKAERAKQSVGLILIGLAVWALTGNPVLAHSDHDHGDEPAGSIPGGVDAPRRLADGDVFVPKPSQRLLRIRTAIATKQSAPTGTELIGTIIPDPSSVGQVQAPMDGQIELAERGISHVGQRVEAGEVLALLSPSIPVADLGTMQQLRAEVEGKLRIAEQRLARLTRVGPGVIAQRDIDDTRAELEALREQKRVLVPKDVERIALKAPLGGIISIANVRAGQVVSARDTLFEIVDPKRLWVEATGVAGSEGVDVTGAHAIDAASHSLKLTYIGRAPALRQQSLPLLFSIDGAHENLTIGSTVKVVAQGKATAEGVVVPDAAVVLGANGLPQVWTKVSAERFKLAPVRTAPLDGARVLVVSGIEAGSRIVVDGAELINQVR